MINNKFSLRAALCILALPVYQAKAAVIFFDGFESPVVAGFDASAFSSGWTLNETDPNQLGLRNGLTPFEGNQVAQINANNSAVGASFSRAVTTTIGQQYTFSLRYQSYVGTAAAVSVDFGSSSSSSPAVALADTWNELTFIHIATSASTLLTITDLTTNTFSSDLLLDAVSVSTETITVPEPSISILLGVGAFSMLFRRNRKRRS